MNREILFRGMDSSGKWHEGSLIHNHDMGWDVIVTYNPNGKDIHHIVKSSTVGQFTGLTDKNGKRIFEGDKLKCKETIYLDEAPKTHEYEYIVSFIDGCYVVSNPECCETCKSGRSHHVTLDELICGVDSVEIIGTIHYNTTQP